MFGLNNIINLAVNMTFTKFPEALNDYKKNCNVLFEVSEMVADELTYKQGRLFVEDYTKGFVSVKNLAFGDKNSFEISP